MRSLFISNPQSTSLNDSVSRAVVPELLKATDLVSCFTQYAGHAEDMVRGLTRDDYDAVIIMGGDGSVNEVLNGLLGTDLEARPSPADIPALAVIPSGSANVFARALGYPNSPGEAAKKLAGFLQRGITRTVSAGFAANRFFLVNVGFGMDAAVIKAMEKLRGKGISATAGMYGVIAANAWHHLRKFPPTIRITATVEGDRPREVSLSNIPFVVVTNTTPWTYAGTIPLVTNPEQTLEKALSLFALQDISGLRGLGAVMHAVGAGRRLLNSFDFTARQVHLDDVTRIHFASDDALPAQVDGESVEETRHMTITSIPRCIEVVAHPDDTYEDIIGDALNIR